MASIPMFALGMMPFWKNEALIIMAIDCGDFKIDST